MWHAQGQCATDRRTAYTRPARAHTSYSDIAIAFDEIYNRCSMSAESTECGGRLHHRRDRAALAITPAFADQQASTAYASCPA